MKFTTKIKVRLYARVPCTNDRSYTTNTLNSDVYAMPSSVHAGVNMRQGCTVPRTDGGYVIFTAIVSPIVSGISAQQIETPLGPAVCAKTYSLQCC